MKYVIVNSLGEYFNGFRGLLDTYPVFSSEQIYLLDENTYLKAEKSIRNDSPNEKFQVRTVEFNSLSDFS